MSWEWSHSPEAYEVARRNLYAKPIEDLQVIWAEIESSSKDDEGFYITNTSGLDLDLYKEKLDESKAIAKDDLAYRIWAFMEQFRTSDNGGFNAWCCPYGCHTVSMDERKRKR